MGWALHLLEVDQRPREQMTCKPQAGFQVSTKKMFTGRSLRRSGGAWLRK